MLASVSLPQVRNVNLVQQAQALVKYAKLREIKKQKALIEIRKALSSNNFYWV